MNIPEKTQERNKKKQSKDAKQSKKIMKLNLISQSENNLLLSDFIEVTNDGLLIKRESSGANPKNVLIIKDNQISSNHSEIVFIEGNFFLSDNKSTNGTFVNIPLNSKLKIEKGMEIDMGNHTFKILEAEKNSIKIEIKSHEDENSSNRKFKFKNNSDCLIFGRKNSENSKLENFICFDDSDLESRHAQIIYNGTDLFLVPFENKYG